MPQANGTDPRKRPSRRAFIGVFIALVIVGGLIALVSWAVIVSRTGNRAAPEPGFERFEDAWASALVKASVEATFPAGPVELTAVRPSGSQPFEATFTAEEITALMNVYRFEGDGAQAVSFSEVEVAFPGANVGAMSGSLLVEGSSYSARIEGPLTYSPMGIDSPGATSLVVAGFTIDDERKDQASDAVVAYLNMYVRAAPGLVLERAEIVEGGLSVRGSAPQRLENPAPLSAP